MPSARLLLGLRFVIGSKGSKSGIVAGLIGSSPSRALDPYGLSSNVAKALRGASVRSTGSPSSAPSGTMLTSQTHLPTLSAILPKPWKPHGYQKQAMQFQLKQQASGLLLGPGMGKTSITLGWFKALQKKGLARKLLVIAPLRPCYLVWPKEMRLWADFNHFKWTVLHGSDKDLALQQGADDDIHIINPEGLEWLLGAAKSKGLNGRTKVQVDARAFKALGYDALAVDELSKFKSTQAVRFKALSPVLSLFQWRTGLTGSPAANGLMGLFGEAFVLDMGRTFGQFITHYRNKYFTPDRSGFGWDIQEDGEARIFKAVKPLMLRMDSKDYLKLPRLVTNRIEVELPKEARRIYNELEKDMLTEIKDRTIVADNAGVASGKCRQIANGGLYYSNADPVTVDFKKAKAGSREWMLLHDEKTDALAELIDELQGSPLLVAYDFNHDLERLQKRLGKDLPHIGKGVPMKRVVWLEDQWNRGKLPFLLAHPQSAAHGLNLQEVGKDVCWHSLTWDYELWDQFIQRVLRQGNASARVTNHVIVAKNTVDEDLLAAMDFKERGQGRFFQAMKARTSNKAHKSLAK